VRRLTTETELETGFREAELFGTCNMYETDAKFIQNFSRSIWREGAIWDVKMQTEG
jgi:hypothetical protein